MDQFESAFRTFSSLGSMSIYDSYTFSSIFPYIQSQFLHPSSNLPEDAPLWRTAVPIACTLGKPRAKELDIVQTTVHLICLKCCAFISGFLQQNPAGTIAEQDLELVQKMISVVLEVLKLYKAQLNEISEISSKTIHFLKKLKVNCHDEVALSKLVTTVKRVNKAIYSEFDPTRLNLPFSPYIRSLHESLLSFQVVGILFSVSGMGETYELASDIVIALAQNLMSSNKDSVLQSLRDIQNSFSTSSDSFQYSKLRSFAMEDFISNIKAMQSEVESGELSPKNLISIKVLVNDNFEAYIPSFSHLLSNIDHENPDCDLYSQLAVSLSSNSDDPVIQSLCSKVSADPYNSISFLALLSILIPLPTTTRIEYFTSILPQLSSLALHFLSLPPSSSIKDAYEKLFQGEDISVPRRLCYAWLYCLSELLKMNMSVLVQLSSLSLPFQSIDSLSTLINVDSDVLDFVTVLAEEMNKQIETVITSAFVSLENKAQVIKSLLDMAMKVKELFDSLKELRDIHSDNGKTLIVRSLAEASTETDPMERKVILSLVQFAPCFGIPKLPADDFEESRKILEKFLLEDSFDYRNKDQCELFLPKLGSKGQHLYSMLSERIGDQDNMVQPMKDLFFAVIKEESLEGLSDEELFNSKITVVGKLIREGVVSDAFIDQLYSALMASTPGEFISFITESERIIEAGKILADVRDISYELMHEKEENTEKISMYSNLPITFSSEPNLRLRSVYDSVSLLAYAMSIAPAALVEGDNIEMIRSVGKATISGCFSLDVIEGKPMLDYPRIGEMTVPWASAVVLLGQQLTDLTYLKHLLNIPDVTFSDYVSSELKPEEITVDFDLVLAQIKEAVRTTDKAMKKLANHLEDVTMTKSNYEKLVICTKDLTDALRSSGMEDYVSFSVVVDKSVEALYTRLESYMDGRSTFEGNLDDFVHIFRKLRLDLTGTTATSTAFDDLKLFSARVSEILNVTENFNATVVSSTTVDILKVISRFVSDAIEQVSHILTSQGIVLKEKGIRKSAERVFDSLQLFYLLTRTEVVDIDRVSAASKRLKAAMSDALAQLSMTGESEDIRNRLNLQFSQLLERLSVLSQEINANCAPTQSQKAESEDITVSTEESMSRLMRRLEIEAEILRCKANLEEAEEYLRSLDEKGKSN